jgi:hypothetical protein
MTKKIGKSPVAQAKARDEKYGDLEYAEKPVDAETAEKGYTRLPASKKDK